jgi:ankyrin repeat protein
MNRTALVIFLSAFLVAACSRAKPDIPQQQQLVDVVCISQRDLKLLFASAKGDVQAMQSALKDGADVNSSLLASLGTPLIMAATGGDYEGVKLLVDHGADVNAVDTEGYTPLISAVLSNNKDSVQLLIARGADVNKERVWTVRGEQTRISPLVIARHKGNGEIVKLLTEAGAR